MDLTGEQKAYLIKIQASVGRAYKAGEHARSLGLSILADFLEESARIIKTGIEYQYRANQESTLSKQPDHSKIIGQKKMEFE